jgi:hypothetical protein
LLFEVFLSEQGFFELLSVLLKKDGSIQIPLPVWPGSPVLPVLGCSPEWPRR